MVNSVAFSPDGKLLAAGNWFGRKVGGGPCLWELATGREIIILDRYARSVDSVAFSPDAKLLASGHDGYDYISVKLWDPASGKEIRTLQGHSDLVWSVAFAPNGKLLASGSADYSIKIWNPTTGQEIRTLQGHSGGVNSVAFSPDGSMLASGSMDGTIHLSNPDTGREIARFVSFTDGEWIVLTPEGYYNASPNGAKHLNVRVGNKVYGVEQFARRFYRPEMVKLALAGKSLPATDTLATTGKKSAPDVKIVTPKNGATTAKDELGVKLNITDTGGGIGDIYLYVNDTLVSTDTKDIKRKKHSPETTFRVAMIQGENRIRAEVYNRDNTMRSDPAVITVTADYKADAPVLHVLAVGIDEFEDDSLNLRFARADAGLFSNTIKNRSSSLFRKINMTLLNSKEKTSKKAIITAFEDIKSKVKAGDYFIFYASSHGDISNMRNHDSKYFLITSNVVFVDPDNLIKDAISQDELVALIGDVPAQNKMIILDTCHSGEAGRVIQLAMADSKPVHTRAMANKDVMELVKMASGSSVFTASQSVEQAIEGFKGHGLFTWTMVEGLNKKADLDNDKFVTLGELKSYVERTVFTRSKEHFKRKQVPYINVNSLDFSLVKTK